MKKVSKNFRLSPDVIEKLDEIVSFYVSMSPIGKVTATDVVEEAIRLLYSMRIGDLSAARDAHEATVARKSETSARLSPNAEA